MVKITFIGAGSLVFTNRLVRDILTFPVLKDATITLMDINSERLRLAKLAIEDLAKRGNYPARIEATTDRKEALKGADVVICTILQGGVQVWRHDIEIPKKYGVDTCVGDTRGPSGILRALRTIPVMLDICRDMQRLCPGAVLLNYTNPMAMLCRAMQKTTGVTVTGLCHSVQGTAEMLAHWIKTPMEQITYTCAGINHLAWYIEFKKNGKDAYPLIRKALKKKSVYMVEIVRNEMFLNLDYYVTESSGHNSEYNWWFRKRPDLIKKYCIPGTGWNPGAYAYILKEYLQHEKNWRKELKDIIKPKWRLELERGHEYAAYIINALHGGKPFRFNGNVSNKGYITNLPKDACVEIPVLVDRKGLHPRYVGALPPQCAVLSGVNAQVEEMAVEAILAKDARLLFQAIANDPLTASVLSLAEIKKMVNEMLQKNKNYTAGYKNI